MNSFEAYKLYLAIKMHFTQPSYDYFRYGGKTNAQIQTYEKRRDKWYFAKLAKHRDAVGYLVALYSSGLDIKWAGDLFGDEPEAIYQKWLLSQQSITYRLKADVTSIQDRFVEVFKSRDGQHPELLSLTKRGLVSFDSFTILNDQINFFPIWDKKIMDPVIWPSLRDRTIKYCPFLQYDKPKIKLFIRGVIAENSAK